MSAPPTSPPAAWRSNPARLSSLSELFALPVVVAELEPPGAIDLLVQELLSEREYASIRDCAEQRIWDFCAGRLCAHRALTQFGCIEFDLLAAADRQPIWPTGLTGSITHTEGFSAAVVGERSRAAALGIDAERISAVHADLWHAICTAAELERLRALEGTRQALAAALVFACKEAFYKCQYPLAGERFEFGEVQLEQADWQLDGGEFRLAVQRASRLDRFLPRRARRRLEGRFCRRGPYVITGLALPAS